MSRVNHSSLHLPYFKPVVLPGKLQPDQQRVLPVYCLAVQLGALCTGGYLAPVKECTNCVAPISKENTNGTKTYSTMHLVIIFDYCLTSPIFAR